MSTKSGQVQVDVNGDGLNTNDRTVVNGVQTTLDEFRGTPFAQVDLRVSREFRFGERIRVRPFAEFFNLFNRTNPGNNFVGDVSALPVPANEIGNVRHICLNADCTVTRPIGSLRDLRVPAGALGDFFGPGTTVGIPFAGQHWSASRFLARVQSTFITRMVDSESISDVIAITSRAKRERGKRPSQNAYLFAFNLAHL